MNVCVEEKLYNITNINVNYCCKYMYHLFKFCIYNYERLYDIRKHHAIKAFSKSPNCDKFHIFTQLFFCVGVKLTLKCIFCQDLSFLIKLLQMLAIIFQLLLTKVITF